MYFTVPDYGEGDSEEDEDAPSRVKESLKEKTHRVPGVGQRG